MFFFFLCYRFLLVTDRKMEEVVFLIKRLGGRHTKLELEGQLNELRVDHLCGVLVSHFYFFSSLYTITSLLLWFFIRKKVFSCFLPPIY